MGQVRTRSFDENDADELVAAVRESYTELAQWLVWPRAGYGPEEAQAFLSRQREAWEAGTAYHFAVTEDEWLVGAVSLTPLVEGRLNLGYWVRSAASGRGVATATGRIALDHARAMPGVTAVQIAVAKGNGASRRVAEKLGGRLLDKPVTVHAEGRPEAGLCYEIRL